MFRLPYARLSWLLAALLPALIAADWPQFLGPTRNGVSTETGLEWNWPPAGPPVLWEKAIGEGYSAPAVAGNRLVVFYRSGGTDLAECLDAASGDAKWKFAYPTTYRDDYGKGDGPRATPLIAGDRVYLLGAAGKLHCLDLASGGKVWERSLAEDYQAAKGFFGVATSPILEGDRLLINIGGKETSAGIVALDKATGKEVWRATNHEAGYSSPVAASIDGVRHVFFFTREGLVSVDPVNGSVRFSKRWRARQYASVNAATPLVIGDELFLSASYGTGAVLLKVRKDGCDEIWKADEILSNHYSSSVHAGGFLYGCDGRQEEGARLRCVELQSGKVRWNRDRFGCASLLLADGHLIALTENGELVLLDASPEAYRELARVAVLGKECRAPLALANGRLYARDNHKLICWKLTK
jgi:outer membrane protein assembly factor BamB